MHSGRSDWTRREFLIAGSAVPVMNSDRTIVAQEDPERSGLTGTATDVSAIDLASSSPSFQYNAGNTGRTDSPGPSEQPSQQWEIPADDPPPTVRSPAVVDGIAYTADSHGGVRTYDFEAGEAGWRTAGRSSWASQTPHRFVHTPVIRDEVVYHATPNNILAHSTSGRFLWAASADWDSAQGAALTTAPVAVGDLVLGCLRDGIYAIDPQTGSRVWKLPMRYQHTGTPAASDGIAYFGRSDGYVYAVDAAAGEVVWKTYVGPASASLFNNYTSMRVSTPTVSGDAVYVTGSVPSKGTGSVWALDATSGETLWTATTRRPFAGAPLENSVAVTDEMVFGVDSSPALYALDREDGSRQWTAELSGRYGLSPVLAGDCVYAATTSQTLRVFEIDGAERWAVTVDERIRSSPVVLDEYVFIGQGGRSPALLAFA